MTNKFVLLFATIFTLHAFAQNKDIDVTRYRFDIKLSDQYDTIQGRAYVYFKALANISSLNLDLTSQGKDGKGMRVLKTSSLNKQQRDLSFKQSDQKLSISLNTPMKPGDGDSVLIVYKGIPADGLIISKNKYGNRSFFADNWPNRGHNWIPCNDDPADKAAVDFIVTAPSHYQVVANGIQIEETDLGKGEKLTQWTEEVPISTKVMVIGVANFAVQLSGVVDNCIPVYSWVYPEDRKNGFYDYGQAGEIMPFFIKNVGAYGYRKLANVESKTIFGGLENANTIFYSENSIKGNRHSEGLLAHEISHQWFGNMATEKTFAHLWLSEGFATYMTMLYMENKYGPDTAMAMRLEDRVKLLEFSKRNNSSVVDFNPDYMALLNANSYEKGGWALHMLRRQIGDVFFWKGIKLYYARYAGSVADTDDLRKVFEEVSGQDLKKFFQQWLFTPGQPELKMEWKYDAAAKQVNIIVNQSKTSFEFPLEIGVREGDGKLTIHKVKLVGKSGNFKLPAKNKPSEVVLDPSINLLFEYSR